MRVEGVHENIFETLVDQIVDEAKHWGVEEYFGKKDKLSSKIDELKQELFARIETAVRA